MKNIRQKAMKIMNAVVYPTGTTLAAIKMAKIIASLNKTGRWM